LLEFVQALHEAFHTDSRWLFVLDIGLTFALAFGLLAAGLAYVVDSGYQRKLREQNETPSTPLVIRDTAEEQRLREENARLKEELSLRNELQRTIQGKLAEFSSQGTNLHSQWVKRLGMPVDVQRESANAIAVWHKKVENYLGTIPRANLYLTKFRNPTTSTGSYPVGINVELAGWWDVLENDLRRLSEIIDDPNLGRP
jgi:hypothetical protein